MLNITTLPLELVQKLQEFLLDLDEDVWYNFASQGNLEGIRWLHEHNVPLNDYEYSVIVDLAMSSHLAVTIYMHQQGYQCTTVAMDWAAQTGHLDIVKWLHENREEGCTSKAMDYAAEYGHLDVVQFLHEHRSEGCTTYAMDKAAQNGHLEVLEFLREHRTEGCTLNALDLAVQNRHSNVIVWLMQNIYGYGVPIA